MKIPSENEKSHLNESLRKIAKGAGVGFTGTFIGMVFGYFSRIIIARFLGASDYGLISLGFAGMSIAVTLSSVGLPSGIRRFTSFYKGKGDEGRIKGTILSAFKISFPLSLIFATLVLLGADWISTNVFHEPRLTPVLRIFSIGIPFLALSQSFIAGTIGFQTLKYKVYTDDLFQNLFKLIAMVAFLVLGFGVTGVALGWVLAIVLMPFLALYFLEKKVFPIFKSRVKAVSIDREIFSFSFPLIFVGIAGLVMYWIDTLMLGYFSTASTVGIYNAALSTARLLSIVSTAFAAIFMPVVTELYATKMLNDLKKTYSVITKWIVSLVLPGFLLMALFSDFIMRIMFGEEFVRGALALSILAFGYLVTSLVGPTTSVLTAYGRTKIIMCCSFVGATADFILNLLLIPLYEINGAAIATGLSLALMNVVYLAFVYLIARMQPYRVNYVKPVLAAVISVAVVYAATEYLVGLFLFSKVVSVAGMLLVFVVLYFFLLLIFKCFEEEDLIIMRALDERLGTRSEWVRKIISRFL